MRSLCCLSSSPLPLPQHTPFLLLPSHSGKPCDPHFAGQSGRLADEQSPLTPFGQFTCPTTVDVRSVWGVVEHMFASLSQFLL